DLLKRYRTVYDNLGHCILSGNKNQEESSIKNIHTTHINRTDSNATKEIIKLRNVAVDQHRVIHQLQRKLEDAKDPVEVALAVRELQQQLERQTRFVKEAESCVQLLEDELAQSHEKLVHQERLSDGSALLK